MRKHWTSNNACRVLHVLAIQDFVGVFNLLTGLQGELSVKFPAKSFPGALNVCQISKWLVTASLTAAP